MKKFYFLAMMLCAGFAFTSCDNDDPVDPIDPVEKNYVVDFEGEKWNALIDEPQMYGPLLYSEETMYAWMDEESGLNGNVNAAADYYNPDKTTYMFWNGGTAISNYIDANYAEHCGSDYQLSVPVSNGSKNFAVGFCPAKIGLADAHDRVFKSMDICPTTWLLGAMKGFDSYAGSLVESGYFTLIIKGYKFRADEPSGEVRVDFARDGKIQDGWKTIDLSSLGAIYSLEFSMEGSDASDWGPKHPTYFAFDNVVIKQEAEQ